MRTQHLGIDLGVTNLKWAVVETRWRAWRASTAARSRRARPRVRMPSSARLASIARTELDRRPAIGSLGIGVPGLYDPATGSTRFLVNMPGDWAGQPVAWPIEAGARASRSR